MSLTPEREQEIRDRPRQWLPLDEWGPKCAGCGADEYRIDGFCSIECRDYHCDEDVADLLAEIDRLRAAPCPRCKPEPFRFDDPALDLRPQPTKLDGPG